MDLSIYNKLIDKIARRLNNGSLKQEDLDIFLEKELGIKIEDDKGTLEIDVKKQNAEQNFILDYRNLNSIFFKIWNSIIEVEQSPEPFTIKYNSQLLSKLFNELKEYKEDSNYERALLNSISLYKSSYPQNTLTKEHIIVLKRKYL